MTTHDRIKGALFGFALGDALGVGCEFMTRNEVRTYYPDGLRHFSQIIRDAHRCQWEPGEWTNDTQLLAVYLKALLESETFDLSHIASYIKEWYDAIEDDISPVFRVILSQKGWADNPIAVAHNAWKTTGLYEASNDAIHRAIATGLLSDPERLDNETRQMILMTNDDSRCVVTGIILARMVSSLLHTGEPADFDELANLCASLDTRTLPFLEMAHHGTLEDMKLDDEATCAWTRKCMASGMWPTWNCDNAEDALYKVIECGGDSDSNAAISGALAGLRYGFDALPDEKYKLVRFKDIERMADRVAERVATHKKS